VPPLSHITSCTLTQSNLLFVNSLATGVSAPNIPGTESRVPFSLLRSYQTISPGRRNVFMFCNKAIFYGEELTAPCPTPKLGDQLLSAVRDCLFNIFTATVQIGCCSSVGNLRTCHVVTKYTKHSFGNTYCSSIFVPWLVLWEVCFLVCSIIIVFELHINGTQNYFKKCLLVTPCPLSDVTLALTSLHKEFVLFFHLYSLVSYVGELQRYFKKWR